MLRILVLEDETYSREALTKILREISEEITVDEAADLASARLLLGRTVSFDLFLLDVNLNPNNASDSSGMEFAKEIRCLRQYEFTPLVTMTSGRDGDGSLPRASLLPVCHEAIRAQGD